MLECSRSQALVSFLLHASYKYEIFGRSNQVENFFTGLYRDILYIQKNTNKNLSLSSFQYAICKSCHTYFQKKASHRVDEKQDQSLEDHCACV